MAGSPWEEFLNCTMALIGRRAQKVPTWLLAPCMSVMKGAQ